jgi:Protein of unknown function (DUF3105)
MADSRKPKPKPRPAGRNQPGRGAGAATKGRPADRGRPADKGKLAKGAAARRLEAKRRRQRTILWSTVAVVALAALIGLILWQGREGGSQVAAKQPVEASALQAGRQAAGSEGVRTLPEAGRDHIGNDEQPDNWNSNPPTSGDHLVTPLPRGVYNSEQDMRALVHNLEHGYVVILYKGISEDDLDELRDFVEDRSDSKLVLAPYSALEQNGVALTAWRNLEVMDRLNLDVVQAFVNDFMVPDASRSSAPEPAAA